MAKSLILLAGTTGLEPATFPLDQRGVLTNNQDDHLREHSNQKNGGDDGTRTRDLRRDRPAF